MSLESTIRGVLTNQQAPKEQEKVEVKESKEEKVVQFISSLNEAKDPEEYDQEGDMMKSQLRQIGSAIDKLMGMVKDDDNLPEWVQSKMTKATDYIRSVRDYLESEKMNEEWVCGKCNCDPCTCEENLQEGINQKKFAAGAKAMKAYAMKHGGVDKADFMKVADSLAKISRINLLQAGQELSRLNRLVDNQDTDVRERIYVELKKVGLVEALEEKTLTPAELKKREEIAKAIERENPDMPMPQKMAIATAQAKKTAEAYNEPQGQAKSMMSPLQKIRIDKEKADRDRDGKLKPGVIKRVAKEEVTLDEAMSASSIEKAMRKALKDRGNYKNGKVNWNFIDADTYMEVKPGRAQVKQFYRMFDQIASKLTKEMNLKEDISEAKKVTSMQIHKVLAKTKNSREGIAALKKAFRVNDMEAKKMLNQVMNEETIDEISRSMTPMRKKFGGAVDPKKFDAYKKFVKQNNVDEPTIRMILDNPDNAESKRMMKNNNIAKAVKLRIAAVKESVNKEVQEAKNSDETVNIRQSLKKAIDMRGQKEVVFKDGSKAKISVQDAEKAMKMLDNTRMAKAKQDLTIRMMKSHQDFKDALAGKKPKVDPFALKVRKAEEFASNAQRRAAYASGYKGKKGVKEDNNPKIIRHLELAKKARAEGDYDKANYHTQLARQMQSEGTFLSKFKEELKDKKRDMKETKGAPKGYHFTKDGKLKKGDAGQDGPGGKMLRSDPLDKQRSKIPPLPENDK